MVSSFVVSLFQDEMIDRSINNELGAFTSEKLLKEIALITCSDEEQMMRSEESAKHIEERLVPCPEKIGLFLWIEKG